MERLFYILLISLVCLTLMQVMLIHAGQMIRNEHAEAQTHNSGCQYGQLFPKVEALRQISSPVI
jgi:hypothetical protein